MQNIGISSFYFFTGRFGKKPDKLLVNQVREELHARGIYDTDKVRKCLDKELNDILKGAQRVATLLVENPLQSLKELNVQNYLSLTASLCVT